jgi:Cu(I)/Ag(I) efflux system membrane fusion protein
MKKNNMRSFLIAVATLITGILIGWLLFGSSSNSSEISHSHESENINQIWTCSMHPQIRKTEAGDCPICGMDLIPLSSDQSNDENPEAIRMSATAMQLANVQTAVVRSGEAVKKMTLTGKVTPDERAVFSQTSHISGRIERLNVNYTGEIVRKGQVIATLYSPDLVTAQEELLIAYQNKDIQPELLKAAKEKLKNWKLTKEQVNQLIESGKTMDQFPVLSDLNGVATKIITNRGDYIKQGGTFYEVADLSKLWVLLDIHESDLVWVKKGDQVKFKVKAFPTESFTGTISFIDPIIDSKTRVAHARIEINNSKQKFKPEMLVTASLESNLQANENFIVVPKSAVMWTGERSVIYVKTSAANGMHFTMREVELGASLGNSYIIQSGLSQGEEIAVNGTFSIDAAAQLAGKPSMMNPTGGQVNMGHNHGGMKMDETSMKEESQMEMSTKKAETNEKAKKALVLFFESYFELKNHLIADDFQAAYESAKASNELLNQIDMSVFTGESYQEWMSYSKELKSSLLEADKANEIEQLRTAFIPISNTMIQLNKAFRPLNDTVYTQYCPMANNNKGADWLSKEKEIKNPYFGSSMLNCGELK